MNWYEPRSARAQTYRDFIAIAVVVPILFFALDFLLYELARLFA